MPTTTLVFAKVYTVHTSKGWEFVSASRAKTADTLALAKDAGFHRRGVRESHDDGPWYDVSTTWVMTVDNGRGEEWYRAKWEESVCRRPGFEGV